ncbi:hypothetical protein BP00DRAFT_16126 [Aspergillus indologenus CBS 114.80]|uniref:Uncharacterized protein n=1 Tax=Aspergillus indologenus CBS 114.80 TaxID=1450541 RepID=A0A2V5HY40_9EURO|nr:hypothetical protein BP00DRAFT_16126 [Aspergillus indologenus CBS 114.80]
MDSWILSPYSYGSCGLWTVDCGLWTEGLGLLSATESLFDRPTPRTHLEKSSDIMDPVTASSTNISRVATRLTLGFWKLKPTITHV